MKILVSGSYLSRVEDSERGKLLNALDLRWGCPQSVFAAGDGGHQNHKHDGFVLSDAE